MLAAVAKLGATDPRLFGSVARGDDDPGSDLDLLVTFPPDADIVTLLALEEELAELLTVRVDVVSSGSSGRVLDRARRGGPAVMSPAEGATLLNGEVGADREGRVERRLGDLAEFVREAAYLTSKGREAYLADSMDGALVRNAGERILIKVATVAEKLPSAFKDRYPDVDWQGINRMRNLVAHHDDWVSHDLVWATLSVRIPELGARLSAN